jgi:hypothetical protein
MNTASRPQVVLNYLLMIVCSMVAIYPLVGVLLASLYPPGPGSAPSGFALPPSFAWHNYVEAWDQGKFASSFTTSVVVAAIMVPASVVLSILGGYAFATMRFPGSRAIFYLFILGLIIPTEATIVPLYYDVRDLGLLDTYWALILLETSGELAFGIFWMRAAFISAPRSLLDAARIDGASMEDALEDPGAIRPPGDPHPDRADLRRQLERVLPGAGVHGQPHDRAGRAGQLLGAVHDQRPAGVGRGGDRRGAHPGRLHRLPAAVHPRRADGRDQTMRS